MGIGGSNGFSVSKMNQLTPLNMENILEGYYEGNEYVRGKNILATKRGSTSALWLQGLCLVFPCIPQIFEYNRCSIKKMLNKWKNKNISKVGPTCQSFFLIPALQELSQCSNKDDTFGFYPSRRHKIMIQDRLAAWLNDC